MNAVVKLGGYISRGVVTVSAPFHPFGGAVDVVVVEQKDGSFKSSPWYVQFGKFQGVLKAKENVVSINVNGVDADLHMYLDSKGGAYFLREVGIDEGMPESVGSSGDHTDGSSSMRTPQKIVSYNFVGKDRAGSLERAEIAADLLEVRWTTSLSTRKHKKDRGGSSCSSDRETSIHDDKESTTGSCRTPKSNGFHGEGDPETPVSTGLANFMESFTLEETYLDPNATEISVGSNGDVQSSTFRGPQVGDERRLERVDTIYCEASESFMDGLDDSSGESSENVCSSHTVSGKMDVPNQALGNEQDLKSEFPSSISECKMSMNTEALGDRNHCRSIEGSKSDSVTATDVETVFETKVEVTVQCNTTEGPVKYVEELIVDQTPSNQEPSLSNSFIIEEATISLLNSIENLRSPSPSSCHSTSLFPMGLCENNDNLGTSMNEFDRAAFQVHTTNSAVLENIGEQFLSSSDLDSSELQRIQSMESTSSNSITKQSNSQDVGSSSEDKVGLSVEKPYESQFYFSDLDGSEVTKNLDTQPISSDSLEVVNDPHYFPESSKEKLGESTGIPYESRAFSGHTVHETLHDDHACSPEMSRSISTPISIGRVHEQVDRTEHTVESLPSFWSHEAKLKDLGANFVISRSLDSSIDNMRLAQGDVPSTLDTGEQKLQLTGHSSMEHMQISEELKKIFSDSAAEISLCRHLLYEGMGHEAAAQVFDAEKLDLEKSLYLGSDIIRNDRLVVRIGRLYFPWDAALPIISAIGSPKGERILQPKGMIIVEKVDNGVEKDPQQSIDSGNNTWTLWPFNKTKSTGRRPPIARASTFSQRIMKKMVWTKTPTSEQLASLNLKEGRNKVTFTFSTQMLGEQKVDARIYLWKWNARIVISDVDGTITKSDVLGQFMPLVGVDWSQTGVAHLFSAIKENGYEVLFLSARAISQASLTRQFLFNLMQEGKALPEGPVIISPDGLFPSLYREVIRRAPHEFKIACLKDIRDLFPPDQNPFYAGFGNRDTDELSYLKMGIPQGKIFIINPKGEVAVQRRVDRKSYASLHTLVHDMFPPPTTVSAFEQEDFNQWNFWRLPPPEDV